MNRFCSLFLISHWCLMFKSGTVGIRLCNRSPRRHDWPKKAGLAKWPNISIVKLHTHVLQYYFWSSQQFLTLQILPYLFKIMKWKADWSKTRFRSKTASNIYNWFRDYWFVGRKWGLSISTVPDHWCGTVTHKYKVNEGSPECSMT